MFRLFSASLVVAAALPSLSSPVSAASDIAIAAINTGRLYVVGTTERPHTTVTLDDRFRTESDDTGKFQYELVYHPASCIVAAIIEGVSHEAVVGNCGQQVMPGTWLEPHAAVDAPTLLNRVLAAEPDASAASFRPARSREQPQNAVPAVPLLPVFTAAAWTSLFVQSEPALPSAETVSSFQMTGTTPPCLPAPSKVEPARPPATSDRRQGRSFKVQPVSFRSPATHGSRSAEH
jgi:hypothetical protein